MNDDASLVLNYAIHPGQILQDTLDEYSISQKDLANRIGITPKHINDIVQERASISPAVAQKLEFVFKTSSGFWLTLQKNYDEIVAKQSIEEQYKNEKHLLMNFTCYKELSEFKFVKPTLSPKERYVELLNFFGVSSLSLIETNYAVQYRKANKTPNKLCLAAWFRLGEIHYYNTGKPPVYDKDKFKAVINKVKVLTSEPINVSSTELQKLCFDSGVLLAFTPLLNNTYINGSTRWLNSGIPLIQISARNAKQDIFWFTFLHEAGHIIKHARRNQYIDWSSDYDSTTSSEEEEANRFAADSLINPTAYANFVNKGDFSKQSIVSFARVVGVSSDIVAGRLANDRHIEWSDAQAFRKTIKLNPSD